MSTTHTRSVDPDEGDELEGTLSFGESVPAVLPDTDEWQGRENYPSLNGRDIALALAVAAASIVAGCVAGFLGRGA